MTAKFVLLICQSTIIALCLSTADKAAVPSIAGFAQNPTGRELPKEEKPEKPEKVEKPEKRAVERSTRPAPKAAPRPQPAPPKLIISAPPGALIELDGRPRGFAGVDGNLILTGITPGEHRLNVRAEGFEPWQGSFRMDTAGTKFVVPIKKKPTTGRLTLSCNEPGADIFIDNKISLKCIAGQTLNVDALLPGPRQIRAVKDGFQEWRLTVNVTAGETAAVNILMRRSYDPDVLRVPEGVYMMGNDKGPKDQRPAHQVFIAEFEISSREITNRQYKFFIDATNRPAPRGVGYGWTGNNYPEGQADKPVVFVSWEDAVAFCRWLSEKTGKRYRLPTEAEWEKSARLVGEQYASVGNIWEWCQDWYDQDYYKNRERINPRGPSKGKSVKAMGREGEARVIRGGGFNRAAIILRAAERNFYFPSLMRFDLGFRVVREVTQ